MFFSSAEELALLPCCLLQVYFFHCEEARRLVSILKKYWRYVSIFKYIDAMLLNLDLDVNNCINYWLLLRLIMINYWLFTRSVCYIDRRRSLRSVSIFKYIDAMLLNLDLDIVRSEPCLHSTCSKQISSFIVFPLYMCINRSGNSLNIFG
jgi:hypothetical protein